MRTKPNKKSKRQRNWEFHFGDNTASWKSRHKVIAGLKGCLGKKYPLDVAARALLLVASGKVGKWKRSAFAQAVFKSTPKGWICIPEDPNEPND